MRHGGFLLALVAGVFHAATAAGQGETANALQEWGMLGTWSARCDQPASGSNSRYTFVIDAGGRAYLERDFGNQEQNDRNDIVSAQRRADGTLAMMVNFKAFNQIRLNVYAKSDRGVRVVYNRGPAGDVTVEDGILKHNGRPTPWTQKCD